MIDIVKVLREVSWRIDTGIVNFDNEKHRNVLRTVLAEMQVDPSIADEVLRSIKEKKVTPKVKKSVETPEPELVTSELEITAANLPTYILKQVGDVSVTKSIINTIDKNTRMMAVLLGQIKKNMNIYEACDFLNTSVGQALGHVLESPVGTSKGIQLDKGGTIGRGELSLLILCPESKKADKGRGDVFIDGKAWEIKKVSKKSPSIMAGGTTREQVLKFTSFIIDVDGMIAKNGEKLDKLFANIPDSPFNSSDKKFSVVWDKFVEAKMDIEQGTRTINFSSIGKGKFTGIQKFMVMLKDAYTKLVKIEQDEIDIRGIAQTFMMDPEDKEKLKSAKVGQPIDVDLIPMDTEKDMILLNFIERLGFADIIKDKEYIENIPTLLKTEFISEFSGGLIVVNEDTHTFTIYDRNKFMEEFEFTSINQGNRPNFALKKDL